MNTSYAQPTMGQQLKFSIKENVDRKGQASREQGEMWKFNVPFRLTSNIASAPGLWIFFPLIGNYTHT